MSCVATEIGSLCCDADTLCIVKSKQTNKNNTFRLMEDPVVCLEACENIKEILTLGPGRDEGRARVRHSRKFTLAFLGLERASILQQGVGGCFL